ncbi:nucleoside hydrolase [Streptomyces sp. NPDC051639]|uniref:nucleoside hydrolase n=1 Tax=Streptomyces sp. NPDC051639 TaxID=3155671 RepID=UPI00341B4588
MSPDETEGRHLIVDTDTLGINDDALALYYLFALGRVPRLITTVFGNASAATSQAHARTLAAEHGLDIDVVRGCEKPLWWSEPAREHVRAAVAALPAATYVAALSTDNEHFWGASTSANPHPRDGLAPRELAKTLQTSEACDILAIGPLTNIARAIQLLDDHTTLQRHRLWISGGSIRSGNVTGDAEFNAYADPEALHTCLGATWGSLVMVPLEALAAPRLVPAAVTRIRATDTPLGAALDRLERESPRGTSTDREPIWDVVAAALMAEWDLPRTQAPGTISVSTDLPHRGRIHFEQGQGAHQLVTEIDPDLLVRRFEAAVSRPRTSP